MIGLDGLPLLRLRFDLMALDDTAAPAFKGDLLRRGLLWWLSEQWCLTAQRQGERCRGGCRQGDVCLFGRLVEPAASETWSSGVRKLIGGETPPPAFALWDGQERRRRLALGSLWSFELTLIGELAASKAAQVIAVVQESAEHGMGHKAEGQLLRSKVLRVTALARPGGQAADVRMPLAQLSQNDDGWALMPVAADRAALLTTFAHAQQWAAAQGGPVRALALRFRSPMVLKEQGRQVFAPELGPLARSVMRRLRILSEVHGAGEWPREVWGPALDAAEAARLDHAEVVEVGYGRNSERSGEQEVLGFSGQAWYSGGDFGPLLAALWYGQWVQAGKGYAFGNGRYEIESATP